MDDRRNFVSHAITGAGMAWIAANWPAAAKAAEMARANGGGFTYFTPQQAGEIDAISAQIIPTTDTPGAREAQVVYFIDLALVSFAADEQPTYQRGFEELQAKVMAMFPSAASIAALTSDQQIQLLTAIEDTPFFRAVRSHTVMGMFSSPQHGGNFNKAGWKLIGFDDSLNFKAPFGAYDR